MWKSSLSHYLLVYTAYKLRYRRWQLKLCVVSKVKLVQEQKRERGVVWNPYATKSVFLESIRSPAGHAFICHTRKHHTQPQTSKTALLRHIQRRLRAENTTSLGSEVLRQEAVKCFLRFASCSFLTHSSWYCSNTWTQILQRRDMNTLHNNTWFQKRVCVVLVLCVFFECMNECVCEWVWVYEWLWCMSLS